MTDFSNAHVLVIGDCMLDRYFFGKVSRISPEAPVPVAKISTTNDALGGAGNVANNLVHLGAKCTLIGAVGDDESGSIIHDCCMKSGIDFKQIRSVSPTIVKIRVLGDHQQIVRIDFEDPLFIDSTSKNELFKTIDEYLDNVSIVIISDYGKGLCSPGLCNHTIENARKRSLRVLVDPKGNDWNKYRNAAIVTPNVKELSDISGKNIDNEDSLIENAGASIRSAFNFEHLLVTRSEHGMSLINQNSCSHFPTEAQEVFDVSGAGDTVMATLAAALSSGYDINHATRLANKAAGIVCGKIGTAPIEIGELRSATNMENSGKFLHTSDLIQKLNVLKGEGKTIVFTNGCFDLIHRGHIYLFREAKKLGSILVVAINSDESIRKLKGNRYPVNDQDDRAHIVSSIKEVDFVTIFDEETPETLLEAIQPDIIVKGGNYRIDEIIGRGIAKQAIIIPELEGYSTGDIRRKFNMLSID
jgi:D-beta-D-heptose 7-phosphate kinase/D-beta-D-heptose 1-phosphate adenosyltransferase